MTDVYSNHSQFVLLNDNRRRWFDGRSFFVFIVITVPIIIFCGIYTIILKTNDNLLYPRSNNEVPYLLRHRVKIYADGVYKKNISNPRVHINTSFNLNNEHKLVCYYNFPNDANSLQPDDIDPFLCTHINVGFAYINNSIPQISDSQLNIIKSFVNLKIYNANLKILLCVGGAGEDLGFDNMVKNHQNRKLFIAAIVNLVRSYGIDGVDLDWEFPNQNPGHDVNQKMHFTQLLEEFRATINKQKKHKFILTLATAAPIVLADNSYDIKYMNQFVDFINLMTYDFHFYTKLTPFTGINSPLFPSMEDKGYFRSLNINDSVHFYISNGMKRHKIMVGLPTYAHTFWLTNAHNNGLYAPVRGYGRLGANGFADYTQVCTFLSLNNITPVFDMKSKSPYATKNTEWISFDNEQSLSYKAEYVRDFGLGGVMVFALNADDYRGACKSDPNVENKPFPLIRKVKEILDSNYSIF